MADLNFIEKNNLESLFGMGSGYVLDFSNRTFQEFFSDSVCKNIYDDKYNQASGSKANLLRAFWRIEANHLVGKLLQDLLDYAETLTFTQSKSLLIEKCRCTAVRLLQSSPVPEIDAIVPNAPGRTFETLARSVRDSIENNEPEAGLDRLHTFVVKYIRAICERHSLPVDRDRPLHSSFGEYIKYLRLMKLLHSEMTERILRSCISTLEAFNHVRNNQSFAHDNEILNYGESLLIFNHVTAAIRFIESIESDQSKQSGAESAI